MDNKLQFVITFAFVWSLLYAKVDGSEYQNTILVSSVMKSLSYRNVHINLLPGTLYEAPNVTGAATLGLTKYNTRILSMDVDYSRHRVYMFDSTTATVYILNNFNWQLNFAGLTLTTLHTGLSRYSVRLAVDWVSNNLYWTDPLFGWIVIQSASSANLYHILVKDAVNKPYALAVDPVNKYIFWSDNGPTKKIERATLTGDNREVIVASGLVYPTSIDIDRWASKIVWVDSERDTVETANFDGTGRQVIRKLTHTIFYDVAVFKNLVGVVSTEDGSLKVFNKSTGSILTSLSKTNGEPFVALALYSADVQPSQTDRCPYKGCSDICVNEVSGPVCLCREGYKLDGNGLTCSEDLGSFHRAFMWSVSNKICMMDIRSLTSNYTASTNCFFTGGSRITHFDIDMETRRVIFVDGMQIYRVNIQQYPVKQRLLSAAEDITGISVDWRDDNIYWCKGISAGTISVLSGKSLSDVTLINGNLTYPKDLNVIPFREIIVWISGTYGTYRIEKSNLTGLGREELVPRAFFASPKGLTVDVLTDSLYFIDGTTVKVFGIESRQTSILAPSTLYYSPKLVLTYKNYFVVADSSIFKGIKVYEKSSKPEYIFEVTSIDVAQMTDMKVLDASLQSNVSGPCDIFNGDCEQICIPVGRNRTCFCEYGFKLDSNNRTCSSSLLSDNFLLVTDWTHNKISQFSLVNDDIRAVDTDTYGSPIGVVFNHETKQLIWSTTELINRMSLNGSGYKVILNTDMQGFHADRFAIDYTSGNIFYTANNVSLSGFIGIGILSPDGLHKRLIQYGTSPRDIALDPEDGILFWTDHGSSNFVRKANMDGSNAAMVLQTDLVWPNGIAVDTKANVLYITDGGINIIHRCTYAGICIKYLTDNDAHLMDIELLGDYLYYTAWNRQYVTKLHKTNSSLVSRIGHNPELGRLDALSGYSSTLTTKSVSIACSANSGRGPCSTFCLPTPTGQVCGCEDGVSLLSDGRTCENAKTTTTSSSTTPTTTTTIPTTTSTTPTTTTTTPTTTTTTLTTTTTTPTTATTTTPTTTTTTPTTTTTTPTTTTTTPTTTTTTPTTTTTTTPTTTTTTPTTTTTTTTPITTTTTPTTTRTTPTTTTTTTSTTTTTKPTTTPKTLTATTTTTTLSTTILPKLTSSWTIHIKSTTSTDLNIPTETSSTTLIAIRTTTAKETILSIASKSTGFPVTVLGGIIAAFGVLVVIIVILVLFLLRRRRAVPDSTTDNQSATSMRRAKPDQNVTREESNRPSTTYDLLIDFDILGEQQESSTDDFGNKECEYATVNEYEQLKSNNRISTVDTRARSAVPNDYQTLAVTSRPPATHTPDGYEVPLSRKQNSSDKAGFANPVYTEDLNTSTEITLTNAVTLSGVYAQPSDGYTMSPTRTLNIKTDFTNPLYTDDWNTNNVNLCEEPVDLSITQESQDGYATPIAYIRTPVLQTKTGFTNPDHCEDANNES